MSGKRARLKHEDKSLDFEKLRLCWQNVETRGFGFERKVVSLRPTPSQSTHHNHILSNKQHRLTSLHAFLPPNNPKKKMNQQETRNNPSFFENNNA